MQRSKKTTMLGITRKDGKADEWIHKKTKIDSPFIDFQKLGHLATKEDGHKGCYTGHQEVKMLW